LCDPITLGLTALAGGAALFGGSKDPPPPPPVINPPVPQNFTSRAADADVRVGDGLDKTNTTATPQYTGFTEKRVAGKSLGGLGRGGLGL
jgi:hypothetical protein